MPLVTCPDCQAQISDAAPACPRCGRPKTAAATAAPAPGRAERRRRYAQADGLDRATIVRVVVASVALMLLAAYLVVGTHSRTGKLLDNLATVGLGVVLMLPRRTDGAPASGRPGGTWGTWFADSNRERNVQISTIAGGVLVFAGAAALLMTLLDPTL